MHAAPDATPTPLEIQHLQALLMAETERKEVALAKVVMLEAEIAALKTALAAQALKTTKPAHPVPMFNGQTVLIVDDQTLNLTLLEGLLDAVNLTIACCTSAAEAIAYVDNAMPDLILMDIQMPGMDGYTATRTIRAKHGDKGPIILAMTANNSADDEQKSLAAGMQGHLCKPIDADTLIRQLDTWLNSTTPRVPPDASGHNQPCAPIKNTHTDELPGIDLTAALVRLRGNRVLLEEVIISFAEKATRIIPDLQHAIEAADAAGAARILHKLKGTSANLSAIKIAPLAGRLEAACKNSQLPQAHELVELDAAICELITTANRLKTPAAITAHSSHSEASGEIKECLGRIKTLLNTDLGQAEETVDTLITLCQNTRWAEVSTQLRTLFYQFNLRAVHELISTGFD